MRRSIRNKILMGYGIILLLLLVVFVVALVSLMKLGRAGDAILKENYKSILAADNMITSLERQDSAILLVLMGYTREGTDQFHRFEPDFMQWLSRAQDNITVRGEKEVVDNIRNRYTEYLSLLSQLLHLKATSASGSNRFYHDRVLKIFQSIRDDCVHLREMNQETMYAASARAANLSMVTRWTLIIAGFGALVMGLLFSIVLSRRITHPLYRMMEGVKLVSEGKYGVPMEVETGDELGLLAHEFNTMNEKLREYHEMNIDRIILEKKKSDAILKSIDDGIIFFDGGFTITDINPTAARILGVEPGELTGRGFFDVMGHTGLFEPVKALMEKGESVRVEEGKNILSVMDGGNYRHYLYALIPVITEKGDTGGYILSLKDVTKLKEIDRLKSEFVMTASHELRTPLTGMELGLELLDEKIGGRLEGKEKELLASARTETRRLRNLVDDLLELSRIEAGKIGLELAVVAVKDLFEKAVSVLARQADEKAIELSFVAEHNAPPVKADPNKITWVLTNLISNALRYTGPGGCIKIAAEAAGPWMRISVADNGMGIPFEYQSRIFDKFVQVDSSKSPGGSGLGLAICREIVRAHGGAIWVDSRPGEGSTFVFTLPLNITPFKEEVH